MIGKMKIKNFQYILIMTYIDLLFFGNFVIK